MGKNIIAASSLRANEVSEAILKERLLRPPALRRSPRNDSVYRGVTLMELLIVLVIVGILAALRFSDFGKLNEKNKGVEAEANLYMIYNAQKRYALENEGVYYDCPSPCDGIYDKLGIELKESDYFSYEISAITSPITAFTASAIRQGSGGLCDGRIMTIDQDGGEVDKGCERW